MIKDALKFIIDSAKPEILDVDGQKFTTGDLSRVDLVRTNTITTSTLTGIIDYLKNGIDENMFTEPLLIHVESENTVSVISQLRSDGSRNKYMSCQAKTPKIYFDRYLKQEEFNVMLQSTFLDVADRGKILSYIGNIKEENVKNTADNGTSQAIMVKTGIASVAYVEIPNPVTLVPFRTFIEIEQPESKYVLRVKDGPEIALFEADGGEWRLAAMLRIKDYLQKALPEFNIIA